jgi:hypothetical protein
MDENKQIKVNSIYFRRIRILVLKSKQVNGTWACENDQLLNGYLKHELGFQGCQCSLLWRFLRIILTLDVDVMSDWSATHSTASAEAGLDVRVPSQLPGSY